MSPGLSWPGDRTCIPRSGQWSSQIVAFEYDGDSGADGRRPPTAARGRFQLARTGPVVERRSGNTMSWSVTATARSNQPSVASIVVSSAGSTIDGTTSLITTHRAHSPRREAGGRRAGVVLPATQPPTKHVFARQQPAHWPAE